MFDVKLKEHWLTSEAKSQGIDEHILELLLRHARSQWTPSHVILPRPLNRAINSGFIWAASPEGYRVWRVIHDGGSVRPSLSDSAMSMVAHVYFIDFKEFE